MTSYGPRTGYPPGTSYPGAGGGPAAGSMHQIPEGKATTTVYSYIRDGRYADVVKVLSNELTTLPESRPILSLMAYCYFMLQDFQEAADWYVPPIFVDIKHLFVYNVGNSYEQLTRFHPEVDMYRLQHAQSLYKAGLYEEAQKAAATVDNPELAEKVLKLQAAIKYSMEDLVGCKALIDQTPPDDPDTLVNQACLLYKEGKFEEACGQYLDALKIVGYRADLSYNVALCHYMLKQYVPALKYIADIIERGIREHPELSVGMATEGMEVRSVGNSQLLHETYLVEAFNLKAAIEYHLRNVEAAREAMTDMPPRNEQELDPVTLHNQALMSMDEDPTGGFEKLNFLLQQVPAPPEVFGNLLLLYTKYQYVDLAADLIAENPHLTATTLDSYLYEFIEATLLRQSSPEEAYNKFDDLATKHADALRKLTKQVQEARQNHDEETVKRAVNEYDDGVERYIPVLMAQAKIYWDRENYHMVEKIFRKSVEFCNEHDVWKLNVAHVLFMQESKYKEAISFYEPIVKKQYDNILNITAIVLANLCVSYIMTSQNEEAEELMRKIEKEEERLAFEEPTKRTYHLCIVNLVIGTLYCAKGNYEFGISRIMKSLEPFNKKLGTDTWYYAKRCLSSLFEMLAKHMILLKDSVFQEVLQFLDNCEFHGRDIPTLVNPLGPNAPSGTNPNSNTTHQVGGFRESGTAAGRADASSARKRDTTKSTVSSEARLLKSLYLRLYE
ncbi:hypothetical protein DFS34DRAFT_619641 [Phlyctochytrium arcticum]|nr:hypothetical protein DFS34DRAFT_619641 [Phlyctochytrium arcticum]